MLKYIIAFIAVLLLMYVTMVNLSSVSVTYACSGEMSDAGAIKDQEIFIRLEQYRPWVGLWSDSEGMLYLEIPNKLVKTFTHVADLGDQVQIFGHSGNLHGNFSTLSNTLALETGIGFFDGTCERARNDA